MNARTRPEVPFPCRHDPGGVPQAVQTASVFVSLRSAARWRPKAARRNVSGGRPWHECARRRAALQAASHW